MNQYLEAMISRWKKLGIEPFFIKVHHFSSDKFKSEPSTLYVFYKHCELRKIKTENLQTVQRAIKVAELYDSGISIDFAIKDAWDKYPVLRR